MSEVLSTLKVMPETKREIKVFGDEILNSVMIGDADPLEIDGRLKAIEELIKYVRKSEEFNEYLLTEAEKHGNKSFESGNFKYQVKEVGTKYDFSECGDVVLIDLKEQEHTIKENIKEREAFLKAIKPDSNVFDGESGCKLLPPVMQSTTKVVTLLK